MFVLIGFFPQIHFRLNLELRDNEGRVPLWLALSRDTRVDPMDEDSLAAKLVKHGASADAINNITGEFPLFWLLFGCF